MARQTDISQEALDAIDAAVGALENKLPTILKAAFDEGGDEQVQNVLDELHALRAARFELLRARLDKSNPSFAQLARNARDASRDIDKEVKHLDRVSSLLATVANAVNLAARLLVLFAI